MTLFSKLFEARHRETIRLLANGFAVDRDGVELFRVLWHEVLEIVAFKRDLITTDCVCLAFRPCEGDLYCEVNEEISGFAQLINELPNRFDGILPDWFISCTQPPFPPNYTRLSVSPPAIENPPLERPPP